MAVQASLRVKPEPWGSSYPMTSATAQHLIDNLTTAVLTFDRRLTLTSINPAGEVLFATSAKRIVGHPLNTLLRHSQPFVRSLRQTFETRHSFTARGVRLNLPDRRQITVDCMVTLVLEENMEPELLVELNQVDRLLRLSREDSSFERHAASRAVLRGLAHEVKNPLGGLRGAAQLLERELADKGLKEYTHIIIHEADRLRNLVDRVMGTPIPFKTHEINVHEVLEHVRKLVLVETPVGITVRRDYDPSLPSCDADSDQLIQAVLNVMRNSVQALGGRGTIILRTRIERNFTIGHTRHRLVLRIDIEDNGPGIPADLRDRIFYPMVTGRADGTGLGLSIAQDIVSRHAGLIECTSKPGRTIFTLYLPTAGQHGEQ